MNIGDDMKNLERNRKGMTLIEVLLSLLLLSLVVLISYNLLFSSNKSFSIGKDKGLGQQEGRNIGEILKQELRYSSKISQDSMEGENIYYSLQLVDKDGRQVLIKKVYSGDQVIEREIGRGDWDLIRLNIIGNKVLETEIKAKDFESTVNIPLENILSTNITNDFDLSNKIYFTLAKDTFVADNSDPADPENPGPNPNPDPDPPTDPYPNAPQWENARQYNFPDRVKHKGKIYEARWYTQNNEPGTTNAWEEISN